METTTMYDQSAREAYLLERGFEPRTTVWRHGLAALSLKGTLEADRYKEGVRCQCIVPSTPLRFEPVGESPVENQLLFGHTFVVYASDARTGLAWGQAELDQHVGFVRTADLTDEIREHTHWVSSPTTYVFPRPDRKAEPVFERPIPLNARVTIMEIDTDDAIFARIGPNQWVFIGDLREIGDWFEDPVHAILAFADHGVYLSGHSDGLSFDCSGITQAGWRSMGINCSRDADQQREDSRIGFPIDFDPGLTGLRPFDQVYWPGHLALMIDETQAIHATGGTIRRTVIEPVAALNARRKKETGHGVETVKRL